MQLPRRIWDKRKSREYNGSFEVYPKFYCNFSKCEIYYKLSELDEKLSI